MHTHSARFAPAPGFEHIRVGVGVIVRKGGRVLLGRRRGSHGSGQWAFPGGHQELGETAVETACRELREETGLRIPPEAFAVVTSSDDLFPEIGRQYVTHYVVADCPPDQEPQNEPTPEPQKCDRWEWFAWERLPHPLWKGILSLRDRGVDPFTLPAWAEPPARHSGG